MLSAIALCTVSLTLQAATASKSCTANSCTANDDTDTAVAFERKSMIQRRADLLASVEFKVHPDSDVAKTGRGEWIIYPEGSCGQGDLESLAKDMPTDTRAVAHGHPEKGGLCFFTMEGTHEGVRQKLAMHRWNGTPKVEANRALYVDAEAAEESERLEEAGLPWGLDLIDQKSSTMDGKFESMGNHKGKGVKVYVFDTGIRTSHREFEGRAVPELETFGPKLKKCFWKIKKKSWYVKDCAVDGHGHGTFCAGIIGGKNVGVAPKVGLHAVKVIDGSEGKVGSLYLAFNELLQRDLESTSTVFSLSLNFKGDPSYADVAFIEKVTRRGITLVVAAGNRRKKTGWGMTSGIVVGAMDRSESLWKYNNVGVTINIFAPGVDITSAWSGSDSEKKIESGTSAASAHVAGAAALLLSEAKAKGLTYKPDSDSGVPSGVMKTLQSKGKLVDDKWRRLFVGKEDGWMEGWQKAVQVQRTGTKEMIKKTWVWDSAKNKAVKGIPKWVTDPTKSKRTWRLVLR